MDPQAIVSAIAVVSAAIKAAVDVGPIVIKTVEDARPFAEAIVRALLGREPTADEISALEQQLSAISAQLQADLPPEQSDDV